MPVEDMIFCDFIDNKTILNKIKSSYMPFNDVFNEMFYPVEI